MNERSTTIDRIRSAPESNFGSEIRRAWDAAAELKEAVILKVESGDLAPMTGLGIVSCIAGQVFNYGFFHGQPASADLLTDLAISTRTREREHAAV